MGGFAGIVIAEFLCHRILTYSDRRLSHIQKVFTSQAWFAIVFQESRTAQKETEYEGFASLSWSLRLFCRTIRPLRLR
jgi:hypothetical protein